MSAIAQVLEVNEEPGRDLAESLVDRLGGKRALVLLDNAEHLLLNIAVALSPLVRDSGTVSFLVTSRERLQVTGEQVYAVPELAADDAVELFLARAASVGVRLGRDDEVANVCARLDQLPLAVELAAARTVLFTPAQLLERLGQRLDLLKGGRDLDARQQTLRATIEWSHDLLDEAEQQLFRRLSVFAGGCTYEAAEEVCGADPDTLQSLLDKSLLRRRDEADGSRYWLLETIREYAQGELREHDEESVANDRHADFFANLTHAGAPHVVGGREQAAWVSRLVEEEPNLRAALEHTRATRVPEVLASFVVDLGRFWYLRSANAEGQRWFESAGSLELEVEPRVRVDAGRALFQAQQGASDAARVLAERCVAVWRGLPDCRGISDPLATLGILAVIKGEFQRAADLFSEALEWARAEGDPYWEAASLVNLAEARWRHGLVDEAVGLLDQAADVAARSENDEIWLLATNNVGSIYIHRGDYARAAPILMAGARRALHGGFIRIALFPIVALARLAVERERWEEAALLLGFAEAIPTVGELDAVQEGALRDAACERIAQALSPVEIDALKMAGAAFSPSELVAVVDRVGGEPAGAFGPQTSVD